MFPHDLPHRSLRKLSHPELAEQLRSWIVGREQNRYAREFAMDLARWCEVKSLATDLAYVTLDPDEEFLENREWQLALRLEANRQAPQAVLEAILRKVDKNDQSENGLSSLHDFDALWSPALVEGLLSRLDDLSFKTQSRRTILEHLLQHGEPKGFQRAQALLAQQDNIELRRHAAALLLTWDSAASWHSLAPLLEQEPEFAKTFIAEVAHNLSWPRDSPPKQGLDEAQTAELYLWLETHFPAAQDPVHHGAYRPTTPDHIKHYRDGLINRLQTTGTWAAVQALEHIATTLSDRDWLKWACQRARAQAMDTQWQAPSWEELSALLADPRSRLIRTEADLWQVVLESLGRLQNSLRGEPPLAPFLWDETSGKPKSEGRLSDFVKSHLSNDLNRRGVIVNREVEIRNWSGRGRGESLDLLVQATNPMGASVSVVVEVKGCWNDELDTAMETQLRDQYLVSTSHSHGIYLVGWYGAQARGKGCKGELAALCSRLDEQAKLLSTGGLRLAAFTLDLHLQK